MKRLSFVFLFLIFGSTCFSQVAIRPFGMLGTSSYTSDLSVQFTNNQGGSLGSKNPEANGFSFGLGGDFVVESNGVSFGGTLMYQAINIDEADAGGFKLEVSDGTMSIFKVGPLLGYDFINGDNFQLGAELQGGLMLTSLKDAEKNRAGFYAGLGIKLQFNKFFIMPTYHYNQFNTEYELIDDTQNKINDIFLKFGFVFTL